VHALLLELLVDVRLVNAAYKACVEHCSCYLNLSESESVGKTNDGGTILQKMCVHSNRLYLPVAQLAKLIYRDTEDDIQQQHEHDDKEQQIVDGACTGRMRVKEQIK
jgi:hypothetical protein